MKKHPSRLVLYFALLTLGIIFAFGLMVTFRPKKELLPPKAEPNYYLQESSKSLSEIQRSPNNPQTQQAQLPEKAYVAVPFLVQAPGGNWDAVHEEACEEASLAMVDHYIKSTAVTDPNADLNQLLDYESKHQYGTSISLSQLNEIALNFYGLRNGRIEQNVSIEDIKREVSKGRPVIVGAAGKILPNPNFRNGGPNYHMLVITGYDDGKFITNDPGTRLGKDFRYNEKDLYIAIHDWNSVNILEGKKNYLVFD